MLLSFFIVRISNRVRVSFSFGFSFRFLKVKSDWLLKFILPVPSWSENDPIGWLPRINDLPNQPSGVLNKTSEWVNSPKPTKALNKLLQFCFVQSTFLNPNFDFIHDLGGIALKSFGEGVELLDLSFKRHSEILKFNFFKTYTFHFWGYSEFWLV